MRSERYRDGVPESLLSVCELDRRRNGGEHLNKLHVCGDRQPELGCKLQSDNLRAWHECIAFGCWQHRRRWRDRSPLHEEGTVVLLHDLRRTFGHGPQTPYRNLFHVLREGALEEQFTAARGAAAADTQALDAYRQGRAPHPLLPYVDWASCAPVLERAGRVLVAGCRDAGAARALGLVPTHNIPTALEMARGIAGGSHRLGVLLAPPYVPLIVS